MASHQFQTEVSKLLNLIIHSLYSHKEIFLRELISNASDALDKLKYLNVSDDAYKSLQFNPKIQISFDSEKKLLTLEDSGIGMNEVDLMENLGTIARSGTRQFIDKLAVEDKKDSNLIGQFGVGFYSCFMVADKVEVISKKALDTDAWLWTSDGKGGYDISKTERASNGTTIILHLNEEGLEYTNRWQIEELVKKYSNHIAFPIYLNYFDDFDSEGKKLDTPENKTSQINNASAIWKRSKSELNDKDYTEFYKAIAHDDDDPLLYVHTNAEGTQEYSTLFYIPAKAPFDLYRADYKAGVKLYVKRVFITDDEKELLPPYLRFVRGVIDSEDLPLNVSREILQQNRILNNIRQASIKKILSELESLSKNNAEKYTTFTNEFNRTMKEGLYSDYMNKDSILELVRFKSTKVEGWTSLADYVSRMKDGQKAIYYITGENEAMLRNSPHLEMYKKDGFEVLIMHDEIDEIVIPTIGKYKEHDMKAVNRAGAEEEIGAGKDTSSDTQNLTNVISKLKTALGDKVKDVRFSKRLTDSASCIVADSDDPSMQLQAIMKAMGQNAIQDIKPILEINALSDLVKSVEAETDTTRIEDIAVVLLSEALLIEGASLKDPMDFVKRMNRLMK